MRVGEASHPGLLRRCPGGARRVRYISSDEEPLIPSGRNVVPRLSSAESVVDISPSQNFQSTAPATPGAVVEAGTWVDPPDSLVPCDSDLEVSVSDNLMDSDEELEFEENLLRGNSSTVPGVLLQNRISPLVESPIVRETAIDEGSENFHSSALVPDTGITGLHEVDSTW